jgi:hypothetical protein
MDVTAALMRFGDSTRVSLADSAHFELPETTENSFV